MNGIAAGQSSTKNTIGFVAAKPIPIVMVSINRLDDGAPKDTAANILRTSEFVVLISDEAIAQQMHLCSERLPPDQSEIEVVGFSLRASQAVAPPCIVEAPVAFECVLWETLDSALISVKTIGCG